MNWMHSCQRVAELLSQRQDEPLGKLDSFLLRFHLSMCGDCRRVEGQLDGLKSLTTDLLSVDDDDPIVDDRPADRTGPA